MTGLWRGAMGDAGVYGGGCSYWCLVWRYRTLLSLARTVVACCGCCLSIATYEKECERVNQMNAMGMLMVERCIIERRYFWPLHPCSGIVSRCVTLCHMHGGTGRGCVPPELRNCGHPLSLCLTTHRHPTLPILKTQETTHRQYIHIPHTSSHRSNTQPTPLTLTQCHNNH